MYVPVILWPVLVSCCWLTPYCIKLGVASRCGILKPGCLQWLSLFEETIQRVAPSLFTLKATLSQSPSIYCLTLAKWLGSFFLVIWNRGLVGCFLFSDSEAQKLTERLLNCRCGSVCCLQRWALAPFPSSPMHLGLMLLMEERGHVWLEDFHLVLELFKSLAVVFPLSNMVMGCGKWVSKGLAMLAVRKALGILGLNISWKKVSFQLKLYLKKKFLLQMKQTPNGNYSAESLQTGLQLLPLP